MKLFNNKTDYTETILSAIQLKGEYSKSVIFHCYWNGVLNEKHLYSILSCYYFNVYRNKHKIILWLENNTPNEYNIQISKYAEIREFSLRDEKMNTNFTLSSSDEMALRTNARLAEMQIRIRENTNRTEYQIKLNYGNKVSDCYKNDKANYCYASYSNTT